MSTYANVLIQGEEFHCTADHPPEDDIEELSPGTILRQVKHYVNRARRIAKPGHIPEVAVSLISADAHGYFGYYPFFRWGFAGPEKTCEATYEVEIGPRGGLRIRRVE